MTPATLASTPTATPPPAIVPAVVRTAGTSVNLPLVLVTLLGLVARLVSFGGVRTNPFYDAAVRSMGQSWHNFFYGAFDPAGQLAVDKIPVDLWLQVLSTKLLGFSSVALRLPEVVAGILAVPLLYDLVRRLFGVRAATLSAAALAVLPISVVTARSDTMDSLMMLCVVGAAWLVERAARTGSTRSLVGAGAVMGLAFNVKLFEALVALPALLVFAVLALDGPWRGRVRQLAAAGAVFVGVALSWLTAASLGPGAHPYPIGSTNGSVWNVVFAFNGYDRIKVPASAAQRALDPAGPLRLFATTGVLHGRFVGSMLVAALALGAAAVATAGWRRARGQHPPVPATAVHRRRQAGVALLGVWLLVGIVLFSKMNRLYPRYEEAFTPAVAATVGVSLARLVDQARRDPVARWLLVAAVTLTAAVGGSLASLTWPAAGVLALVAAAGTALAAAVLPARGRSAAGALVALATVAVLAVPAASTAHLVRLGTSSAGHPGHAPAREVAALGDYLIAHQGRARYEAASSSVAKTGPLIVRDGRPILQLTSLNNRPTMTAAQLASTVAAGQVRYVLLGRGTCSTRRPCPPVVRWARNHGTDVSGAAGQRPGTVYRLSLAAVR